MTTPQPRPHQVEALTHLMAANAIHDRMQLVMACGTGKTLVGRWHAQAIDANAVLVLVPSLSLVAQTLAEWRTATGNMATGWRFRALVVCSDPTTAEGIAERDLEDEDGVPITGRTWEQAAAKVTTDPVVVERFLRETSSRDAGVPRVVFSTYHSSPVVAAAQKRSDVAFDLVLCDEAHRLAGAASEAFTTVLDSRKIVARKRVFMTATPKILTITSNGVSMDDPTLFGPVAHTVTFSSAIATGLLSDYRVLVATESTDTATYAPAAALVRAVDDYGVRRVLSFHGRVRKAEAFAFGVGALGTTPGGHKISARHVSGSMPAARRTDALTWLGDPGDADEVRVVSNARCLAEGVDVPAVDGILFADTRGSVVEIIQAIGRVLRPAPGKTVGTIVLPVAVPADADADTVLSLSAFAPVWVVLRALRAHDQRLAGHLDELTRDIASDWAKEGRTGRLGGYRVSNIEFSFPDHLQPPALHLHLVEETGSIWERNLGLLQAWAEQHDGKLFPRGALVPYRDVVVSLGEWAEQQRILHRRGFLDSARSHRLEQVPGWVWDKTEARWWASHRVLVDYAAAHGTVAEHEQGESRFKGLYSATAPRRWIGIWMAEQRQAYRLGVLTDDKAEALEALPGWSWEGGLPAVDVDMVEALRVFVEFEKHAKVPEDHLEDGLRLGAWCWAVRRRRETGNLAPALLDEILAATPSKDLSAVRFQWHTTETKWRIAYFALKQYAAREGVATPSGKHREVLPDTTVGLAQWCALQRLRKRRGELPEREVALLKALPGWQWEIELQWVQPQEPVELRPGQKHGTPGAYARPNKCRCAECLEWRRVNDRERLAAQRAHFDDPVDAGPVRKHLEAIEAVIVEQYAGDTNRNGRPLVATSSGVPLGVIRKVMRGDEKIERRHAERLLSVTAEACLAQFDSEGSRGRLVSTANRRVDPGPTFELIDDLHARGFGIHWIARELGYETGGVQIYRDRQLAARIADAVARLHADVGDLVMPDMPRNKKRPSLAQLRDQTNPMEEAS